MRARKIATSLAIQGFLLLALTGMGGKRPAPAPGPLEAGVNAHMATQGVESIVEMGARWIRGDANWCEIERTRGAWDFSVTDRFVSNAERLHLKIFLSLAYSPEWASSTGKITGVPDPAAWVNFVQVMVRRYGSRVAAWGIWNEPNIKEFFTGTAEDYFSVLLKPAHSAIRAIRPDALVVGPDLALLYTADIPPADFLMTIAKLGAADYLDVVSHHAYGSDLRTFKSLMSGFRKAGIVYKPGIQQFLARSGLDQKPFWLTEFGWSALGGEDTPAANLAEAIRHLKSLGWVHRAFIYELQDDPRYVDQFRWGLLRADGSRTPAWDRVRQVLTAE